MPGLKGGLRAEAILASLTRGRFRSAALARASRTVGDLQWRPAQSGSIQLDDQRTTWHSGHIHAILSDGDSVIAASDTGGVWLINPIVSPSYRAGYQAIPLSDRWVNTEVRSMAFGPDGIRQVFVGAQGANALNLLQFDTVTGSLVVKSSDTTIALPFVTTVFAIVVFENPRRIAIATDRDVWWAEIPIDIADGDAYDWQPAAGLPGGQCTSLARGPGLGLVANAATPAGVGSLGVGKPIFERLFFGEWQEGTLTFAAATVPQIAQSGASLFKVASCRGEPQRVYAVAADDDGEQVRCVLRSNDGGRTWAAVTNPEGAGDHGFHNRALAVSASRPDVAALGWQRGAFLSTNGGASWTLLDGGDETGVNGQPCAGRKTGRHDDVQALYFPPLDHDELLIGSDGGVVCTHDLGRCFDSQYNRNLAVLQFYGPGHPSPSGTLSVSSTRPGLLTGGTQDNGNIALVPDADAGSTWHKFAGGDGGITRIIDPIDAVLHVNSSQQLVRMSKWNEARHEFEMDGTVVPELHEGGASDGVDPTVFETVVEPAWRRGGQLLYAVAGSTNGDVYGFFANPDGTGPVFVKIANVGQSVSAIASLTGAEILVGRADGTIVAVDTMSGSWSPQMQDATVPPSGAVARFEIPSQSIAYALKSGTLLRFHQQRWTALPAEREWTIFTAERDTGRLFAAVDTDVFSSSDGGLTWVDASAGLPVSPHCTDLRIGEDGDGGRTLYLTTYGRSVWRASIMLPPGKGLDVDLPPLVKDTLFGVLQDGGGVVRIGGRLVRIPPRGAALDVLAGLAIIETARAMSPESSREIQRTTLEQMTRVLRRAIEEIG